MSGCDQRGLFFFKHKGLGLKGLLQPCCRTPSPARDAGAAPLPPAAPAPAVPAPAAPAAAAEPEPEEEAKEIPEEEVARRAQGLAVEYLSNRDLKELRLSLKARAACPASCHGLRLSWTACKHVVCCVNPTLHHAWAHFAVSEHQDTLLQAARSVYLPRLAPGCIG